MNRTPTFTSVQFRESYAKDEVDAFVSRAAQELDSPAPTLRPEDVRAVRFAPVRLRQGYDMGEVDDWLDELEQHLTELLPAPREEHPSVVADLAGASWGARLRKSAQETPLTGQLAVLGVVAGLVVGLVVGLAPAGPSVGTATTFGLIISVSVVGLLMIAGQAILVVLSVFRGVALGIRRLLRPRGQDTADRG
jgi:DivIVA domain-containing protein